MRNCKIFGKITSFLLVAALIMVQGCFAFAAEEPVSGDAVAEEQIEDESVTPGTVGEESVPEASETEEPVVEQPEPEEPSIEEPVAEEEPAGESVSEDEVIEEPAVEESVVKEPEEETVVQEAETAQKEPVVQATKEESAGIQSASSSIPVGAKVNLKEEFGIDSDYKGVKYSITAGKNCAEISGSTLVAKKPGEVNVKVTYKYDGEKGEDETSFSIYAVGFKKKTVILNEKGEYNATENMKGDLSESTPVFSSSAETVATIDQTGKVNVLAGGTTVISAEYSYGDRSRICKFKLIVKLPGFKVSSKNVNFGGVFVPKLINLEKGTAVSYYLDANETRAEFTDQEKGKVKLKGLATDASPVLLHCKAGSEELTCTLTTTEPYLGGLPKNYDETGSAIVRRKQTRQFSVKGIAKGTPVTWSSSDDETVSVSAKGLVKAKQFGYATITANVEGYGDLSVDIEVPDPSDNE